MQCKFAWLTVCLLAAALGAGAYQIAIKGSSLPISDGRIAILLTPGERDLVLTEMREFLESAQQIVENAASKDMNAVAAAARKVGSSAVRKVPISLMAKLPVEFKKLGFDTHGKFDQLALDAEQSADPHKALVQLATLMRGCVTCHAGYWIDATPPR